MSFNIKNYSTTIFEYVIFWAYVYLINPIVLDNIEIIHGYKEGTANYIQINGGYLSFLIIVSILLEIASFRYIPYTKKGFKSYAIAAMAIPRLILFFELIRILAINFWGYQIVTNESSSLKLFFIILLIVVVKEIVVVVLLGMYNIKSKKYNEKQLYYISRLLFLPFFLFWFSIYQQSEIAVAVNESQYPFFVFFGLYSIFIYLPLQIPWIILSLEKKKKIYFHVIEIFVQPLLVYLAM